MIAGREEMIAVRGGRRQKASAARLVALWRVVCELLSGLRALRDITIRRPRTTTLCKDVMMDIRIKQRESQRTQGRKAAARNIRKTMPGNHRNMSWICTN